jgi:hypothetical protein
VTIRSQIEEGGCIGGGVRTIAGALWQGACMSPAPLPPNDDDRNPFLSGDFIARLEETSKSIFRSKTFWLQVITLLSTLFPQVRAFIAANPVDAITLIAAVNVILRFATSGRVTLLSSKSDEEKTSGDGWNLLLAMVGLAASAAALPGLFA